MEPVREIVIQLPQHWTDDEATKLARYLLADQLPYETVVWFRKTETSGRINNERIARES